MSTDENTRLTKRRVDAMQPGETIWDGELRGLCCRCQRKGKVYQLKTRINGRQRWLVIGTHGAPWTPDSARHEALRLLVDIRSGLDIAALRNAQRSEPTLRELCVRFLDEHARPHKKPSSVRMDEKNIANHILPLIGDMRVKDVTRSDIETLKVAVREGRTAGRTKSNPRHLGGAVTLGGPGAANRCLALLSKMFNLAELWGWRPENSNPCRMVAKYPERRRQRFLSDEELIRLGRVLDEVDRDGSESVYAVAAVRLLLLTGARLSEITKLRWDWVDLQRGFLLLPDSKTGERAIFLSTPARTLLATLPRAEGNPHVIVGLVPGSYLINLQKPWGRIRERAGLSDVRIHDLRHSFASLAASRGASLPLIGQLLGHTQPQTTQRYAHLAAKPVHDLNETIGEQIAGFIGASLRR